MADDDADVFAALAHPTRRRILQDLVSGELAAGEIAGAFDASGPTISRHLAVLRQAGLVAERRDANRILYSLQADRLASVVGDYLATVTAVGAVTAVGGAPAVGAAAAAAAATAATSTATAGGKARPTATKATGPKSGAGEPSKSSKSKGSKKKLTKVN